MYTASSQRWIHQVLTFVYDLSRLAKTAYSICYLGILRFEEPILSEAWFAVPFVMTVFDMI